MQIESSEAVPDVVTRTDAPLVAIRSLTKYYTRGEQVYVTHSLATDQDWTKPFPLPIAQAGDLTVEPTG